MRTFTIIGDYGNTDDSPDYGRVIVTPSVLPLVHPTESPVVAVPFRAEVVEGKFEVEVIAGDAGYLPQFSLKFELKMNDGSGHSFEFMPLNEGEVVDVYEITPIPLPIPPGTELAYAQSILQASEEAVEASFQARADLYEIQTLIDQMEDLNYDIVEEGVLERLEPPINLVVLFDNAIA